MTSIDTSFNRLHDFEGGLHFRAFRPWLERIPETNRNEEAVLNLAVDFLKVYETKYGAPMKESIFEGFCRTILRELFYHNLWPSPNEPETVPVANPNPWDVTEEALCDYTVPDLTLRKGLWENYPVDVKPVMSTDGTERYSISWNADKLETWAKARAESYDEYTDYAEWCHARLFYALEQYSHKYTVEPAQDDSQICVIAMVHAPRVVVASARVTKKAIDILRSHPVSWEREGALHYVKAHNKNLGLRTDTPKSEADRIRANAKAALLAELATCADCVVMEPRNASEFAMVRIV